MCITVLYLVYFSTFVSNHGAKIEQFVLHITKSNYKKL
nr:MAG TPA: hypothetical protein [Caudoviricetes sp.]